MKPIIIAIDGPAGSGKTTTAKLVAEKLSYIYIDTGAMYRAATLAWIRSGKDIDENLADEMMESIDIQLQASEQGQKTLLNGEDVSDDIRSREVTKLVSPVSAMAVVREQLVAQQRDLGNKGGVVMDGRDIGTDVFPNAELKIFLVASIESRAARRTKELMSKGTEFDVDEIKKQIIERDRYDSSRKNSPLRKAGDAIEIDTSNITIEQQTKMIYQHAKKILDK